jgi:hypothetical protein
MGLSVPIRASADRFACRAPNRRIQTISAGQTINSGRWSAFYNRRFDAPGKFGSLGLQFTRRDRLRWLEFIPAQNSRFAFVVALRTSARRRGWQFDFILAFDFILRDDHTALIETAAFHQADAARRVVIAQRTHVIDDRHIIDDSRRTVAVMPISRP